jgi:hypothetical protein
LFIYVIVMFVIENENNYPTNKSVHKMNTRAQNILDYPLYKMECTIHPKIF